MADLILHVLIFHNIVLIFKMPYFLKNKSLIYLLVA